MAPGLVRRPENRIRIKGSGHSLVRTQLLAPGTAHHHLGPSDGLLGPYLLHYPPRVKVTGRATHWPGLGRAVPWVHDREWEDGLWAFVVGGAGL